MNRRHTLISAMALVVGFATVQAIAQPPETTTTETTVTVTKGHHHYMYYGDHDIYFAPETKTYYWQEGDAWKSGEELPPTYRAYITKGGVSIDLDTERPYERNAWVVEHYKHHGDRDDRDDHDHP